MYSLRNLAPTLATMVALGACSSSKSTTASDSGVADGGGRAIDVTLGDGKRGTDVRGTTTSLDTSGEGGASTRRDALDAPRNRDVADVGKAPDLRDAVLAETTRDTRDGPKAPDAADAPKDRNDKDVPEDSIQPPDSADAILLPNSCTNPIEISTELPHIDIEVDTTDEPHDIDLPCVTGGNDLVLSFTIGENQLVYADTFGSEWNTVLALSKTCPIKVTDPPDGQVSCNDDACDTGQSQVYAVMPYGRHYLVVSGANEEAGPVTIHFQHAPVGSGAVLPIEPGSGDVSGTTRGTGRMYTCDATGPEDSYFWATCPDYEGGRLTASSCVGTDFDTVMSVQIPRTNVAACANGDSCGKQEEISVSIPSGAGIGILTVDGDTAQAGGDYKMLYSIP